jgi:methyl-accepting chemotaxis protein
MKIKFKLSIMMIAILVAVVATISILLLNSSSKSSIKQAEALLTSMGNEQAAFWEGRENTNIQVLRVIADIMSDRENLDPNIRRDIYNAMLNGILELKQNILVLYTVWRPNAIDGMDDQFIGQVGAGPTGQYAIAYTRENGPVEARTTVDIDGTMDYINNVNPRDPKDRI